MKEFIKKYNGIIFLFIAIMLMITASILSRPLTNLDEIWNYNIARNMAEGKLAYKDFNLVQMPGSFWFASIFLKIANEMIVTRILGIALSIAILGLIYTLLRKLKINKHLVTASILLITYMFLEYFCFDYNFFNLFLIMLLILLEHSSDNSKRYNFFIGIVAGLSMLVKQTTGAFVIIAAILIRVLLIKKMSWKQSLKIIMIRCLGVLMPIIIFMAYLTISSSWHEFIDYTILGISTFENNISYLNLISSDVLYIKILAIAVPIYFIGMAVMWILKKDKIVLILLLYGLASFIVVYPIADNIHFLIGALPAIAGMIYVIFIAINNIKQRYIREKVCVFIKYMMEAILFIVTIWIILMQSRELIRVISNIFSYKELNHFRYIEVSEGMLNQIKIVDDFIESSKKPVYILDAAAAIYMIPIDRYNKDYDMFLKGNLGGNGEDGQIEKIKSVDAYLLVRHNANERNWQTPTRVIEYVEMNNEKQGSVETFDVYN